MELWTRRDVEAGRAGARLLRDALGRARARRVRHVYTALDPSVPASGVVLDALRADVGTAVEDIAMRRAGSTVLLDVVLVAQP